MPLPLTFCGTATEEDPIKNLTGIHPTGMEIQPPGKLKILGCDEETQLHRRASTNHNKTRKTTKDRTLVTIALRIKEPPKCLYQ